MSTPAAPGIVANRRERAMHRLSTDQRAALVTLGRFLQASGYEFVTVTPESHRRVNERSPCIARSLRDVFGWNRPFVASMLPTEVFQTLERAELIAPDGRYLVSRVRFASVGHHLFVHASHPTTSPRAVFLGPDTYRFVSLLERTRHFAVRTLDLGGGTGVGGILARRRSESVVVADVNPLALDFAKVNVELAGVSNIELVESDGLREVEGTFDWIVTNPPFMHDAAKRLYRDGGGEFGEATSVRFVREALERLSPGGTLVVYTGSAITNGTDTFARGVEPLLRAKPCRVEYAEIDPDIFGEELHSSDIPGLERIAAVGLVVTMRCAAG